MLVLIVWVVLGSVAALATTSFMSGRGAGGNSLVNLIAGAVGGFVGGYGGVFLWLMVMSPGPEIIFSMLAAGVAGALAALAAAKVVK